MKRVKDFIGFFADRLALVALLVAAVVLVVGLIIGPINPVVILNIFLYLVMIITLMALAAFKKGDYAAIIALGLAAIMTPPLYLAYRTSIGFFAFVVPVFVVYVLHYFDRQNPFRTRNIIRVSIVAIAAVLYGVILAHNFTIMFFLLTFVPLVPPILAVFAFSVRYFHFSFRKYFVTKSPAKVTAVIPNYNYARYLPERVKSIIGQTYPIYELIILDDASTDDSLAVIKKIFSELKQTHPGIKTRCIPNEENSGKVFKQWAKAFENATGDYLWICEADDLCNKHFLNAVMQGFEKDQKVVMSYAESKMIDDEGYTLMSNFRPWVDYDETGHWRKSYINDGKAEMADVLATNNTIVNVSGVVFKLRNQDGGKLILPYSKYLKTASTYRLAGDWYFYAKILNHGSIAYHAESLNTYRSHNGSVSKTTDNFTHYNEIIAVQDEIASMVHLPPRSKQLIKKRREELLRNWGLADELHYKDVVLHRYTKTPVLLSIIIPVYNVEEYLKICFDSVFTNLPKKTEVIVIDDDSPDGSEEIIREYMKIHPEIKYQKLANNSGLSAARNAGLKIASGEFVTFLDPDDYVSRNAYSTMLKKAITTESDLVYCDIMVVYPPAPNHHDPLAVEPRKIWNSTANDSYKDPLLKLLGTDLAASACNKIFKRSLFDGITFPEGLNNEDIAVIPLVAARATKITHISAPYYNYIQRESSIQGNGGVFNENRLAVFDTVKMCFDGVDGNTKLLEKLEGALIPHQLLVILIYTIADIESRKDRLKYIAIFSEKLRALQFNHDNKYIKKYLSDICAPKLIEITVKSSPTSINNYIKMSGARRTLREMFTSLKSKFKTAIK
ncbi:glycosyltransferase family 2 protein [Candidatus Saccharibacteria bacterium]|nr:glycosyltransferase family 2 protein [Candidatus Saccharibacteria bacterium]